VLAHYEVPDKPPVFRMGKIICARPAALLAWIAERETAA
jgi:hypothetical protein